MPESSESIPKFSKELFELQTSLSWILDYMELDLARFLNKKGEGYYFLLYLKSFFYLVSYFSFVTPIYYYLFIPNKLILVVSLVSFSIYFIFSHLGKKLDKIFFKRFKYTQHYYHSEKKYLLNCQNQIQLIFNNQYLKNLVDIDKIIQKMYKSSKKKFEFSKTRISNYCSYIEPYNEKLRKFGLIGYVISLILSILINLIVKYFFVETVIEDINFVLIFNTIVILVLGLLNRSIKLKNI